MILQNNDLPLMSVTVCLSLKPTLRQSFSTNCLILNFYRINLPRFGGYSIKFLYFCAGKNKKRLSDNKKE